MSTKTKIMISLVLIIFMMTPVIADYQRRNPLYHTPTPTPTELPLSPAPTLVQTITPESPMNTVSLYHYKVMVLDGINTTIIKQALQYIPGLFSFELIDDDSTQYTFKDGYAVPQVPRLITVFNGTMHGYAHPSPMGYYYGSGKSTAVYLGQDPYLFSWIIQHECLHESLQGLGINQDDLPTYSTLWNDWMQERDIGFWSGDERQYVERGWSRLQQDFLVSQCLTR